MARQSRTGRGGVGLALGWGGAWLCGVLALSAQAADDADLLQRLDAPDFETRERATDQLLDDETLTEDDLVRLFKASTTAEQRHRLIAVGRHHMLRKTRLDEFPEGEHASLGVSHDALNRRSDPTLLQGEVRIVLTLPGFPGYRHLKSGDRITAIDGVPFPPDITSDGFIAAIKAHRPGDRVKLSVKRGARTFDAEVELASAEALDAMYSDSSAKLTFRHAEAWRETLKRYLAAVSPVPVLRPPQEGPEASGEDAADHDGP